MGIDYHNHRVKTISTTLTTDTSAYAADDQIDSLKTLTDAVKENAQGTGVTIAIVDKASQKSALSIHFFDQTVTVASSDNAELDISDSELASKYVGSIKVAGTDYIDMANAAVATITTDLKIQPTQGADNLYFIVQSEGTPTYTGTTDLIIKTTLLRY